MTILMERRLALPKAFPTFLNAIGAGAILSLAAATAVVAGGPAVSPEWGALLKAMIFPIGLILIVLAKLSLFTGNIYNYGAAVADGCSVWVAVGLLLISWIGNLIGAVWVAFGIRIAAPGFDLNALANAANAKMGVAMPDFFVLAIFCNILVCYAISMARRYDGVIKIVGVFLPIFLFVFFGFEHSIADMFYLLFADNFSIGSYFAVLGIATAGNIIGGALVVLFDYARGELV